MQVVVLLYIKKGWIDFNKNGVKDVYEIHRLLWMQEYMTYCHRCR